MSDRAAIDDVLNEWTRQHPPQKVMGTLQASGVPAGVVAYGAHFLGDPQMTHRGYPKLLDQQGLGVMLVEGPAFLGSDLPEVIITQAPWLGEHTREIASRLLGLSDEDIQALVDDEVLEDPPSEFKI